MNIKGQPRGIVVQGDNLALLARLPDSIFDLIYIDPPFNTGKIQSRQQLKTRRDPGGDRIGFKGQRYRSEVVGSKAFTDVFDDFAAFLRPRLTEAHRLLTQSGSLYLHLDYREVHYCKIMLDDIFGRECFINEIIWAYDYGGRSRRKWPAKHDNILFYAKDPAGYIFNYEDIGRIPYMAPGLVGEAKAQRGKIPTDTWWHTIVSPTGREKTGYPTQKPLGILRRIVEASSRPDSWVLDFFAGSGTTGVAAAELGRNFLLMDENLEAIEVMRSRLPAETRYYELTEWQSANPKEFWNE